jgi:hypothetical protein
VRCERSVARENKLTLIHLTYNDKGRFLTYHLLNDSLKSNKDVLRGIFNTLMNDEIFRAFGSKKVIIVSGIVDDSEFAYHHKVLLTNSTNFEDYYKSVKDYIISKYEDGYATDVVPLFKLLVWNMDHLSNKNIKITKDATSVKTNKLNKITPLHIIKRMFSSIKPIKKKHQQLN